MARKAKKLVPLSPFQPKRTGGLPFPPQAFNFGWKSTVFFSFFLILVIEQCPLLLSPPPPPSPQIKGEEERERSDMQFLPLRVSPFRYESQEGAGRRRGGSPFPLPPPFFVGQGKEKRRCVSLFSLPFLLRALPHLSGQVRKGKRSPATFSFTPLLGFPFFFLRSSGWGAKSR